MPWKERKPSATPQAASTRQQAPRAVQNRFSSYGQGRRGAVARQYGSRAR